MANANSKARPPVTERALTVQQIYREQNTNWCKQYHGSWERPPKRKSSPYAPWIRLAGRWLEQAGFKSGQRVKVNVEQGRLIITAE